LRSRPASVHKYCPVGKIDPIKIVNCLDYIELKRIEVITKQQGNLLKEAIVKIALKPIIHQKSLQRGDVKR
jgi:hypothetical protein